jgi:hypothetical protein
MYFGRVALRFGIVKSPEVTLSGLYGAVSAGFTALSAYNKKVPTRDKTSQISTV